MLPSDTRRPLDPADESAAAAPAPTIEPDPADPPTVQPFSREPAGPVGEPTYAWTGYVRAPEPRPRGGITTVHLSIVVVGLLAGAALFLSGFSLGRQAATTPGTPVSEEQAFVPFWDAYRAVTEHYAGGDVDRKTIIEGAIRGMIEALGDPYSSYLSSEEYRKSLQGISGQFEGVGAEMSARATEGDGECTPLAATCRLVIVKPIEESPADKAGIEPGDIVTHIDGASVEGMTVEDAVGKVRGPKGTTVVLTILRGDEPARDVSIVRDVIVEKEVLTRTLAGGNVGYIRLAGFSETGAGEVKAALKADIDAGRRKIILDLRGNPGGFVTAARTVASQFIAEGPIFWQEDADGVQVPTNAETGGLATDSSVKLVVLIDGGSASAAEIVAGALQDTGRATLVGDDSYGKGTVQEWQPLPDDTGGFRLTVAKWLTPNKRWIHETGLAPDVRADAGPATEIGAEDPSVLKALEVLGATAAIPLTRAA